MMWGKHHDDAGKKLHDAGIKYDACPALTETFFSSPLLCDSTEKSSALPNVIHMYNRASQYVAIIF